VGGEFNRLFLSDCVFEGCEFGALEFDDSKLLTCEFLNCSFTGLAINRSSFDSVRFIESSVVGSVLADIRVRDCVFQGVDFVGTTVNRAEVSDSLLQSCRFDGFESLGEASTLTRIIADVSTAEAMQTCHKELPEGVTIYSHQALARIRASRTLRKKGRS